MSTATPMPTAQRMAIYLAQNGRLDLTDRQARQINRMARRARVRRLGTPLVAGPPPSD